MRKGSGKKLQRRTHALVPAHLSYLDQQEWCFFVTSSNTQDVLGADAHTRIEWEVVDYDPRGVYTSSNGRFTAQRPGRWLLGAQILSAATDIETAGDRALLSLWKNDAFFGYFEYQEVDDPNSVKQWGLGGTMIVDVAVGDYFDVRGFVDDVAQNNAGSGNTSRFFGFQIHSRR